jgi:hypothetical protein
LFGDLADLARIAFDGDAAYRDFFRPHFSSGVEAALLIMAVPWDKKLWVDLFLSLVCAPHSAVPLPDVEKEGWDAVNAGLDGCVLKTVQRLCALRQGRTPEAPQSHPLYGEETLLAYRALDAEIRVATAFEVALKTALDVHCWPLVATALEDRLHSGAYHDLNAALRRDLWECDNEALVAWGEEHVKGHYNTKAETGLLWALGTGSRAGQAAASHTGFLVRDDGQDAAGSVSHRRRGCERQAPSCDGERHCFVEAGNEGGSTVHHGTPDPRELRPGAVDNVR